MKNILKDKVKNAVPFAGVTLNFGSARASEILARSGFDFLMVDLQHGNFDKNSATDSIHAILATQTVPLARVADNTPGAINDVLAHSVWLFQWWIVPMMREEPSHQPFTPLWVNALKEGLLPLFMVMIMPKRQMMKL